MNAKQSAAEEELRERLVELDTELERVLESRKDVETSIDEVRERTRELTERRRRLLDKEGVHRGEVGEMQRALEAFTSQ